MFFRNCGEMGSGVCRGPGEKILYAWGRNAPMLRLPPGKGSYLLPLLVLSSSSLLWMLTSFYYHLMAFTTATAVLTASTTIKLVVHLRNCIKGVGERVICIQCHQKILWQLKGNIVIRECINFFFIVISSNTADLNSSCYCC